MLIRGAAVGNPPLGSQVRPAPKQAPPPILFDRPSKKPLGKADYLTVKLRAVPMEADSQTYKLNVPYFQTGTPE
jgi:hypothetical protein